MVLGVATAAVAAVSVLVTATVPGALTNLVVPADARDAAGSIVDAGTSGLITVLVALGVVAAVIAVAGAFAAAVDRTRPA